MVTALKRIDDVAFVVLQVKSRDSIEIEIWPASPPHTGAVVRNVNLQDVAFVESKRYPLEVHFKQGVSMYA